MYQTGIEQLEPDQIVLVQIKQDQTGSNRTRPAQTSFVRTDRFKAVLTGSNRTQTGPDQLKPVLNGSNRSRPAQSGFDWLQPDQTGSNRFEQLKTDQTGSNWIKPYQRGSSRINPYQTG